SRVLENLGSGLSDGVGTEVEFLGWARGKDVVADQIAVGKGDRRSRQNRKNVRHEFEVELVEDFRFGRWRKGLSRNPLYIDNRILIVCRLRNHDAAGDIRSLERNRRCQEQGGPA